MQYALDTNIVIHYLHNNQSVHKHFENAVELGGKIIIPKMVDYEMCRGFSIKSNPKREKTYRILTEDCTVKGMDDLAWRCAVQVYTDLYHKHRTVGEMDMLIAAFCIANGCTLVTNNTADFAYIAGLTIVDWTISSLQSQGGNDTGLYIALAEQEYALGETISHEDRKWKK